jgi:predicted negative regulator of RcsB-dependent stress response
MTNLKVMAFKVKGEVLEKLNRNDEAIEIYSQAKDIVEKIYGNNN